MNYSQVIYFLRKIVEGEFALVCFVDEIIGSISKKYYVDKQDQAYSSLYDTDEPNTFIDDPQTLEKVFDSNINNYQLYPFIDFSGMKKKWCKLFRLFWF